MNNFANGISNYIRIRNYWLPVLLMLFVQFIFSTESFSSRETGKFILPILKFLSPGMSLDRMAYWHHLVRKSAHVTEYCILGILIYRALAVDLVNQATVRMLTAISIAGAASVDEFHQSFVPARGASIRDVGIDCIGGMVALLLMWVWRMTRAAEE